MRELPIHNFVFPFLIRFMVCLTGLIILFFFLANWHSKIYPSFFTYCTRLFFEQIESPAFNISQTNKNAVIEFKGRFSNEFFLTKGNDFFKTGETYSKRYMMVAKGRRPVHYLNINMILVISLVFAWPGVSLKHRLYIYSLCFPMVMVLQYFTTGIKLIAQAETAFFTTMTQQGYYPLYFFGYKLRKGWISFLENGGQYVLSIVIFFAAFGIFKFFSLSVQNVGQVPRNAPCPCGSGKKYKKCCL